MASPGFVENFRAIFNRSTNRINLPGQGLGPKAVESLSIYFGLNPIEETIEADKAFARKLFMGIAGLLIGYPELQVDLPYVDGIQQQYWETKTARKARKELLVASASKFEITDSKEQGKLARNLTSALSRLFLRLAESGTNGNIDQNLIQSNLKLILQQAWYETHNGVLDLDMTTGQEP